MVQIWWLSNFGWRGKEMCGILRYDACILYTVWLQYVVYIMIVLVYGKLVFIQNTLDSILWSHSQWKIFPRPSPLLLCRWRVVVALPIAVLLVLLVAKRQLVVLVLNIYMYIICIYVYMYICILQEVTSCARWAIPWVGGPGMRACIGSKL